MQAVRHVALALILAGLVGACDTARGASSPPRAANDSARAESLGRARQDSINRAQPGYIVDSARSADEELARFRAAIGGEPATELLHASRSRNELVRRLVRAVSSQDTSAMREMILTAREFADLVYPTSPYTHPPYAQAPGFVWAQIVQPSASGFRRLMRRRGGVAFSYIDHGCKAPPERQGQNTIWTGCTVRVRAPDGDTTTQRWFGSIIERGGRFKFVSYTNQF
jgi:hypothetical protein